MLVWFVLYCFMVAAAIAQGIILLVRNDSFGWVLIGGGFLMIAILGLLYSRARRYQGANWRSPWGIHK